MQDVKSLDERLREDGRNRLKRNLDRAFESVYNLFQLYQEGMSTLYRKHPNVEKFDRAGMRLVLQTLESDMFEAFKGSAEQSEIDNFIHQVNNLQAQLNELKIGSGDDEF